ncbi:hypothetical protein VNI00_001867 [Paramarasmius palmivorus]|uniref:Uncharacterized protein n=1 Tax=Paramarasmius palmivorus TaxID=297713 RepID=A0AAW0E517_9AGAR
MKAFELCRVPNQNFNLSHSSMTSPEALALLCDLPTMNPELYKKLTAGDTNEGDLEVVVDESDVMTSDVICYVKQGKEGLQKGLELDEDGNIFRKTQANDTETTVEVTDAPEQITRRGRRVHASKPFGGAELWEMNDKSNREEDGEAKVEETKRKRKRKQSAGSGKLEEQTQKSRKKQKTSL